LAPRVAVIFAQLDKGRRTPRYAWLTREGKVGQLLSAIGIGFEAIGIVTAGAGLWRTWHDFAGGESFAGPFVERAHATAGRIRGVFLRLLRRPRNVVVYPDPARLTATALNPRVRIGWGPIPTTTKLALAELDRRSRLTWDGLTEARERFLDDLDEVRRTGSALREHVDSDARRLETTARRAAIGGVRLEAVGLFLVGVGLLVQGLGIAVAMLAG
jgi:hypothetical protein